MWVRFLIMSRTFSSPKSLLGTCGVSSLGSKNKHWYYCVHFFGNILFYILKYVLSTTYSSVKGNYIHFFWYCSNKTNYYYFLSGQSLQDSCLKSSPSPKSNLFKELRLVLKRYVRQESQRGPCTKKKTLRKNFICKYKKLNEVWIHINMCNARHKNRTWKV